MEPAGRQWVGAGRRAMSGNTGPLFPWGGTSGCSQAALGTLWRAALALLASLASTVAPRMRLPAGRPGRRWLRRWGGWIRPSLPAQTMCARFCRRDGARSVGCFCLGVSQRSRQGRQGLQEGNSCIQAGRSADLAARSRCSTLAPVPASPPGSNCSPRQLPYTERLSMCSCSCHCLFSPRLAGS